MKVLKVIKTILDLWLQRRHQRVLFICMTFAVVTMWLETGYYIQSNWQDQRTKLHAVLLLLAVGVMIHFTNKHADRCCPHFWIDFVVQNFRRIIFADFILRRLMYQLQLVSQRLPKPPIDLLDPLTQQIFEQVQKDAFLAVQVFRRDANAVLDRDQSKYIMIEEEEEEVRKAGFRHTLVSDQLLRQLLGPYGEAPRSGE
ncbi:hypothetical protein KR032_009307 [Drosophila birchii]|nr:hypothetical protein KR032_009307 [Drosophila birchii]